MIFVLKMLFALGAGLLAFVIWFYSQMHSWTAPLVFFLVLAASVLLALGIAIRRAEMRRD